MIEKSGLKDPGLKNLALTCPGLKSSRLKSLGLKGPGLNLALKSSGVEMSFNHVFLDNGQNKAISSESELFLVEPSLSDLVRNLS